MCRPDCKLNLAGGNTVAYAVIGNTGFFYKLLNTAVTLGTNCHNYSAAVDFAAYAFGFYKNMISAYFEALGIYMVLNVQGCERVKYKSSD